MTELMTQAAAVAVTAALCAAVVRRGTPEIALVLVLAAGVWILLSAAEGLTSVAALMEELAQLAGLDRTVVEPVFKTVVLSILTKLTGEVCRSAGWPPPWRLRGRCWPWRPPCLWCGELWN